MNASLRAKDKRKLRFVSICRFVLTAIGRNDLTAGYVCDESVGMSAQSSVSQVRPL